MTDTREYTPGELTELLRDNPEKFLKNLENNLHVEDFRRWLNDQTQQEPFFSPGLHILFMLVGTMVRPNEVYYGYGIAIDQSLGIKIAEKLFALQPDMSLTDGYNLDLRALIENSTGNTTERTNNNAFIEFMLQHL
jgi:hypothetical protein